MNFALKSKIRFDAEPVPNSGTGGLPPVAPAEFKAVSDTLKASPFATRRKIGAQQRLFARGDPAGCFYLVEYGDLLVHHKAADARPSIRFLSAGDFFIFDSEGRRAFDCDAVVCASLLSLERCAVEELAQSVSLLKRILEQVRASERELTASSVAAPALTGGPADPNADQPAVDLTGVIQIRKRQTVMPGIPVELGFSGSPDQVAAVPIGIGVPTRSRNRRKATR